ncbi:MAG: 5-nitroimidazole antibiotic resistance protein [Peptococcaceae bacterium]|nr:5-nitroimidazole antibiotic resistance protein [Peptococcaceae bacterium]
MFREMRRKGQSLSLDECEEVLKTCTSGVLSLSGDEGYPYGVPLSYVFAGDKIYFHCAKEGHKIDAIAREKKASFCVIATDEVIPEKYTTCYQSVIVFGEIHILAEGEEKRAAIEKLAAKYSPEENEGDRNAEIDKYWQHLCMLALNIQHMTGKQGLEMMRRKDK